MTNYEKLTSVLKEIFQLDQADLDFGIYRIMNQKRDEITRFLEKDLLPQVQKSFEHYRKDDQQSVKAELDKAIEAAKGLGINPDDSPKVKELTDKLVNKTIDVSALENEVFSHLANFFRRYYDKGDFISMRRYKKDVYAIPYEGEEVKLHWANADQYYTKTGENFRNYSFKISESRKVSFVLVEADTEQNNNKNIEGKERKFALYTEQPIKIEDNELHIYFTYELSPERQDKLLNDALTEIIRLIPSAFHEVLTKKPTEKNPNRTLLEKHLKDYTARNTFDYFIHKDLGGFLHRELDFYIKNEVLFLDDINTHETAEFVKQLDKVRAVKDVAEKILTFLTQIEDFQKKLWLKKKFVVETNYCITLDRVPEELYSEIVKNEAQTDEWISLFAIDEIVIPEKRKDIQVKLELESVAEQEVQHSVSYSRPLTINFLKANPYLALDTVFFDDEFKTKLFASIQNIDEKTDGVLIHSENFQAISFLQNKYANQVDHVYIDPPYNAKSSEILYKNEFKDSSWLSLMENRISLSQIFLHEKSVYTIAIDETEQIELGSLLKILFPLNNIDCIVVIHNPSGQQGSNFSYTHEYAFFIYQNKSNQIGLEDRNENPDIRPLRDVSIGNHLRINAANCFYPIYIKDYKIIGFGDVCEDGFHPGAKNVLRKDGVIEVYPIGAQGEERKWVFARQTVESIFSELTVEHSKKLNEFDIIRKKTSFNFKTVWTDKKYSANSYGSSLLNQIFGSNVFSFPKSIYTVQNCIDAALKNKSFGLVLDYFAGSATTGHSVINLNREDDGKRKYILVEMGEYFDAVTKPRIQKVVYSKDWKDGKPVSREGVSHCFKYIRLESYEDTLNNLQMKRSKEQEETLFGDKHFDEEYMLRYMLDVESEGSASLLNIDKFEDPFAYKLLTTRNNETKETAVDLVETFNYLIGLIVDTIDEINGYRVISGRNLKDEKILVIWRNLKEKDNKDLEKFFLKQAYNTRDAEFDRIYVNGDNNLENLKTPDDKWKVTMIEEEFKKRMFDVKDV